ncbi:hypothetical protein M434DRAFT_391772 [Hypoxylon sp. CO27-5]|nr:hypothetical protein M434DRAFT_391772 [Hypoxylon sp. CO27-5]
MSSGSRKFHSKSRNGCGQCKKRRVRCNLESPICLNCRKRKEACDYLQGQPTLLLSSTKPAISAASCLSRETDNTIRLRSTALMPIDSPSTSTPQNTFLEVLTSILDKVHMDMTVSSREFSTWTQELHRHINQFNYLEPTLKSIQSFLKWFKRGQTTSESYASALRYNIEASSRFRISSARVTDANWLAILIFGIGIIIFHFCIALSSSDQDFDFIDMFYILRESSKVGRQVGPYFLNSRLGSLLKRRYTADGLADDEILTAIGHLEAVIYLKEQSLDTGFLYCQTVESLKSWVIMVEGCPQTWRDFIHFPEMVSEVYLQSLQRKNPLALLIFIYWCAIMHQAPHRWFMGKWARRAADSAMSYLGPEWTAALEWPRTVLGSPAPSYSNSPLRARDHYLELVVSLGHYISPDESAELICSEVGSNAI